MAYVPKKRTYKIRWKIAAPLLLLIALLLYAIVSVLLPANTKEEKKFSVCSLDENKTLELLNKKASQTYVVNDYTIYGESLGFYTAPYTPDNDDSLSGKTMQLHNLCSNKTITMTNDREVDQKIALNDLEPGFYEIKVIDNLVEKRLTYKEALRSEPFYSVVRNNRVNKVSIIADKELLKDYDVTLNDHYVFLNVQSVKPVKDMIDVYIDPYGMNTDFQYIPDEGNCANGLKEYKEMYDAALLMKKELESYGLRVEISRDGVDSEAAKAYGEKGRLAHAYSKHAKYFISLRFNKSESSGLKGIEIWHSSYASSVLGKNIMYGLEKNLGMSASTYVNADGSGVGASAVDKEYYDNNIYLRETGGKATFAAMYSDLSKTENAVFKDADGMNAIEIDFGYVSNADDAQFWKTNKEKIVKQCAKSFASAIGASKTK